MDLGNVYSMHTRHPVTVLSLPQTESQARAIWKYTPTPVMVRAVMNISAHQHNDTSRPRPVVLVPTCYQTDQPHTYVIATACRNEHTRLTH